MKLTFSRLFLVGAAFLAVFVSTQALAQNQGDRPQRGGNRPDRGNFDPSQFREQMMQRFQESLGFNDAEWKAIKPLVEDVQTKQRDARSGGGRFGGFGGAAFGGRGGPGGPGGRGGDRGGAEAAPEVEALQKAIESNADAASITAKLKAYRDAQAKKADALKKSQEKLRQVLSAKQEAQLVLFGILD